MNPIIDFLYAAYKENNPKYKLQNVDKNDGGGKITIFEKTPSGKKHIQRVIYCQDDKTILVSINVYFSDGSPINVNSEIEKTWNLINDFNKKTAFLRAYIDLNKEILQINGSAAISDVNNITNMNYLVNQDMVHVETLLLELEKIESDLEIKIPASQFKKNISIFSKNALDPRLKLISDIYKKRKIECFAFAENMLAAKYFHEDTSSEFGVLFIAIDSQLIALVPVAEVYLTQSLFGYVNASNVRCNFFKASVDPKILPGYNVLVHTLADIAVENSDVSKFLVKIDFDAGEIINLYDILKDEELIKTDAGVLLDEIVKQQKRKN